MNDDNTLSDLFHILTCLQAAQRSVERVRMKTIQQNLKYMIDDVEQEYKRVKESK